jgi:2-polyprenyl-6-methoxyphenol hydroxylase-like FAD-dependent oxidoreductase
MAIAPTLAAEPIRTGPVGFPTPAESAAVSPTRPAISPQDHLEPVLVDRLRELGRTAAHFDTELAGVDQAGDVVRARLVERSTGREPVVESSFLVGADGGRSSVRSFLGIETVGPSVLEHHAAILFRADLRATLGPRRFGLFLVGNPAAPSVVVPLGPDDRWLLARPCAPADVDPLLADPVRQVALVRAAAGVPDLEVELLAAMPLTYGAEHATRWRDGNAFLVGDAAHRMPPFGGRGLNTAVADAHNLAWKLAWVVRGLADPRLLDSYEAERGPVARTNISLALARHRADPEAGRLVRDDALESTPDGLFEDIGHAYRSNAIVADQAPAPDLDRRAEPGSAFRPDARPGARAPHAWLAVAGERRSTLDVVGDHLVLLAAGDRRSWQRAAARLAGPGALVRGLAALGPAAPWPASARIAVVDVTGGDAVLGLEPGGALLVRPDGHVAARWTTAPADRPAALATAVAVALGHGDAARPATVAAPIGSRRTAATVRASIA